MDSEEVRRLITSRGFANSNIHWGEDAVNLKNQLQLHHFHPTVQKILQIPYHEQWSEEHKSIRNKGCCGASEIGQALGFSPYGTPYQLWQRKTGRVRDEFENGEFPEAIKHGWKYEEEIAMIYSVHYGEPLIKVGYIPSPVYEYIGASCDRIAPITGRVVELKCPRYKPVSNNNNSVEYILKEYPTYYQQVQLQMHVTGLQESRLVMYGREPNKHHLRDFEYMSVDISAEPDWWEKHSRKLIAFCEAVKKGRIDSNYDALKDLYPAEVPQKKPFVSRDLPSSSSSTQTTYVSTPSVAHKKCPFM